jgi:putative flippase GtrA
MSLLQKSAVVTGTRRVTRFVTVGVFGFVLQITALALLTSAAHWPWLPATLVAVELAVIHNFLWHERWTWIDRFEGRPESSLTRRQSRLIRFARYNAMTGLTSIAGNAGLMLVYVELMGLPPVAGNVLAVITLSAMNFVMSDRCVFRSVNSSSRRASSMSAVGVVAMVVAACATSTSAAAAPAPEAVAAWNRYVGEAEARIERERASTATSASAPADPIAPGEPMRSACLSLSGLNVCDGESLNIPSGTITRWRGSVWLPGVTLEQLLQRLQHPGTPPPQDDVAASRVLSRTPDSLRVYIRLVRSAIVTVTYDTEHDMQFRRWGPALATARSVATRIEELGGDDHGFLWRLNSYWRYRQTKNGVLVELESLTLSRRVPAVVRPIAAPIVTRIARESMERTLEALRRYVQVSSLSSQR